MRSDHIPKVAAWAAAWILCACLLSFVLFCVGCSPSHEPMEAPPPPAVLEDTVSVVCRIGPGWSVVFDRESGECVEPTRRDPECYDVFTAPEKAEQDSVHTTGSEPVVIVPYRDGVPSQREIKPCPR